MNPKPAPSPPYTCNLTRSAALWDKAGDSTRITRRSASRAIVGATAASKSAAVVVYPPAAVRWLPLRRPAAGEEQHVVAFRAAEVGPELVVRDQRQARSGPQVDEQLAPERGHGVGDECGVPRPPTAPRTRRRG